MLKQFNEIRWFAKALWLVNKLTQEVAYESGNENAGIPDLREGYVLWRCGVAQRVHTCSSLEGGQRFVRRRIDWDGEFARVPKNVGASGPTPPLAWSTKARFWHFTLGSGFPVTAQRYPGGPHQLVRSALTGASLGNTRYLNVGPCSAEREAPSARRVGGGTKLL